MSYNTKEIRLAYKSKYNFERSYTEKKILSIGLLVIQYLQVIRLTPKKTNLIVIEIKTVWEGFEKV